MESGDAARLALAACGIVSVLSIAYLVRLNIMLKGTPAEARGIVTPWTEELRRKAYKELENNPVDWTADLPPSWTGDTSSREAMVSSVAISSSSSWLEARRQRASVSWTSVRRSAVTWLSDQPPRWNSSRRTSPPRVARRRLQQAVEQVSGSPAAHRLPHCRRHRHLGED
uniref:Uncharacterized protein n=1 Tax=Bionectria ochroleuca TaxID=29856 RepID=A0A8H7K9Q7_BIOOC